MDTLVQLPSKDLWRGFDPTRKRPDSVSATPAVVATPAQAQAEAGDKCLWCDYKASSAEDLKSHIEQLHFSAIHPEVVTQAAREFLTGRPETK